MSELPVNDMVWSYRKAREDGADDHRQQLKNLAATVDSTIQIYEDDPPSLDGVLEWPDASLCSAFPDLMFPLKGEKAIAEIAKKACTSCVAYSKCRTFALANSGYKEPAQYGVWGGLSENDRRKINRKQKNDQIKVDVAGTEPLDDEAA